MRVRPTISVAFLALVAAAARPGRIDAADGGVRVERLGAAAVEGAFVGLSPSGLVLAGRDGPLPLEGLREARFPAEAPASTAPAPDDGVRIAVHLRGGEELHGRFASGDSEGLTVRSPDFGEARVPFDAVVRVDSDAEDDPCFEPARGNPPRPGNDVVHSRSGDSFVGTLVSAGAAGVVIESGRDRRQTLPWPDVQVLHLDEPPLPPAETLVAEVETRGGSRLAATSVVGDAKALQVETRTGLRVSVPTSAVAAIRWSGGAFVYACDLPFESTFEAWYGDDVSKHLDGWYRARAHRRGDLPKPGTSCPIRLAGRTYRHGIAVHSKSVVTVPLRRKFATFQTAFGLDDASRIGEVTARVLADGKEIWSSQGIVRHGEPPRAIGPLPVGGAEMLTLEVDWGEEMHFEDRAAWADPVLVRAR